MRTTINLDSGILGDVRRATGLRSNSKAAVAALTDFLRRRRLARVLAGRGSYRFHPKTAEWRHLDR